MDLARARAYGSSRPELLRLLPREQGPVLDVGCSTGMLGAAIKQRHPDQVVWGIEVDPAAAAKACARLDRVLTMDALEAVDFVEAEGLRPRIVIFADSLEHMLDPWTVFDRYVSLVPGGGYVLASLPNVAHWDTFWNLLRGRWPYRSRGIHDDTHLRFFGRHNVLALMNRGDARLIRLKRVLRLVERPSMVNRLAPLLCRLTPGPFTYQYLAIARIERTVDRIEERGDDGFK